jgi:hypothetical protein
MSLFDINIGITVKVLPLGQEYLISLPGIHIGITVEVFPLEKKYLTLLDALFPEGLAVLHPRN